MIQFQVGDKAVYPSHGVVEVLGIDEKEISGKINRFYSMRVLDSQLRIMVPVDKAEQVGLREHADKAEKMLPKSAEDARKIADEIGKREIPESMNT